MAGSTQNRRMILERSKNIVKAAKNISKFLIIKLYGNWNNSNWQKTVWVETRTTNKHWYCMVCTCTNKNKMVCQLVSTACCMQNFYILQSVEVRSTYFSSNGFLRKYRAN